MPDPEVESELVRRAGVAMRSNNSSAVGAIAEMLRVVCGANYSEIYEWFNAVYEIHESDFECLLYEAEAEGEQ